MCAFSACRNNPNEILLPCQENKVLAQKDETQKVRILKILQTFRGFFTNDWLLFLVQNIFFLLLMLKNLTFYYFPLIWLLLPSITICRKFKRITSVRNITKSLNKYLLKSYINKQTKGAEKMKGFSWNMLSKQKSGLASQQKLIEKGVH